MANMWERLLTVQTKTVERLIGERKALQDEFDRLLSPTDNKGALATFERLGLQDRLIEAARSRLGAIVEQNALQDAEEARRKARAPLQPEKTRDGFYRTSEARNAVILGILERERRQNAALSRDDYRPAKSRDARKRGFVSPTSFVPETWQYPQVDGVTYDPGTGELYPWLDPCVEYRTLQKMRRAVMAAKGYLGKGYRGPRVRSPC